MLKKEEKKQIFYKYVSLYNVRRCYIHQRVSAINFLQCIYQLQAVVRFFLKENKDYHKEITVTCKISWISGYWTGYEYFGDYMEKLHNVKLIFSQL